LLAKHLLIEVGQTLFRRMTMKGAILIAAVAAAVALGACRREEPAPLKLGADLPVAAQPAR
jgi:hypothetical protein